MIRPAHRRPRVSSINLALFVGLGVAGCGQAQSVSVEDPPEIINGLDGEIRARIFNYEDHSETKYRLVRPDGEEIALDFAAKVPSLMPGTRIAVRGPRNGNRIDVDAYDVLKPNLNEQSAPLTAGPRTLKIAMLNVNSAVTTATLKARVSTDGDSLTAFYRDNSYGDWTFQVDVFGPYTYSPASCQDGALVPMAADIKALATNAGVDLSGYDNFMFYLPKFSDQSCWSGVAEVGVNPARGFKNAINSWYNNAKDCTVLAQEVGHNFGLLHSHTCTGSPYSAMAIGGGSGTGCPGYNEYGDKYTPMGGGCGHFNAPEMGAMQFISGCNTIAVTSTGTYEIGPIETKCTGPQVIRIAGNPNINQGPQYIYLEYRKGKGTIGSDLTSPAGIYIHASAEYGGNHYMTNPDAGNNDYDWVVDPFSIHAALTTASPTWTEPDSKATFTLMTMGATATVQVTMPSGTGAAKCLDGSDPPASPMCGAVDGGTGGTGGAGGGSSDASTDRGDAAGTAGTGGSAGGDAGPGGAAGKAGSGGAAGSAGATGGGAGSSGGTAGRAGSGGAGGASGSSGSGGAAGTTGSGGASGAGGSSGTAGKGGSGATGGSTTSGGAAGSGGPSSDDGCGCSVPGGTSSKHSAAWLLGLAAIVPALRRRTRRAA